MNRAISRHMLFHLRSAPPAALCLTLGGLIPFLALPFGMLYLSAPLDSFAALWLQAYASLILSFLGGIRWGGDIAQGRARWSVLLPAILIPLVAWAMLLFAAFHRPSPYWWLGFAGLFAAVFLWDRRARILPGWFIALRGIATTGAVASMMGAFAVRMLA